jgi:hypothetical protein
MLVTTDHYAAVLLTGSLYLLNLGDGTTIATQLERFPSTLCIDASGDALFVATPEGVSRWPLPALDPATEIKTPITFDVLAVNGEDMLGAKASFWQVWELIATNWEKLPLTLASTSLSFGYDGTLWMTAVDEKDGQPFTGQFDRQGEFLRSYRDEFSPVRVCASTAIEEIAVLERSETAQRLRVLSLGEKRSDAPAEWIVGFEKTIQDCRRFGIVDGKLVPNAGDVPQTDHAEVSLSTGGLTTSPRKLAVRVISDRKGLWLETQSGLRLAFLANQSSVRRIAVLFGPGKESLTVYAGDGAVVAEYVVRGLEKMVEIDAGEVELH